MNKGPLVLRRLGRYLFWRTPALYRFFGLVRGRGDCFDNSFDLWVGGYPRSANTFAVEAFKLANPVARIASHRHIPAFIVRWLDAGKPGIFLLRDPEDAVISWAILWQGNLKASLDYYIDFHRALLPYVPRLFVATFETATSDFGAVIERFNERFGTHYLPFRHEPEAVSECFAQIEKNSPLSSTDLSMCRPSAARDPVKRDLRRQLRQSPTLMRKLEDARALYAAFASGSTRLTHPEEGSPDLPRIAPLSAWNFLAARFAPADGWLAPDLSPGSESVCRYTSDAAACSAEPGQLASTIKRVTNQFKRFSVPVLFVGLALITRMVFGRALQDRLAYSFFYAAIIFTAWSAGAAETFVAVVLGYLAVDWFIVTPGSLRISGVHEWMRLLTYSFVGLAIVWFKKSEHAARVLALANAVQARKHQQECEEEKTQLQRAQETVQILRSIVDSTQTPIIGISQHGLITAWNSAAEDLLGFSAREVIDRPLSVVMAPEGRRQEQQLLEQINSDQNLGRVQTLLHSRTGSVMPASLEVSPVKDRSGKLIGASLVPRLLESVAAEAIGANSG